MGHNEFVDDDESVEPYEVRLTDEALYAYADIPSRGVRGRVGMLLDFLAMHPYYGQAYAPYYPSARPPVPCRIFFCDHYGVYYHVNEEAHIVTVITIEDERRNPLLRFGGIN